MLEVLKYEKDMSLSQPDIQHLSERGVLSWFKGVMFQKRQTGSFPTEDPCQFYINQGEEVGKIPLRPG